MTWLAIYLGIGFLLGFSTDPMHPTRWWSHGLCTVGWLPLLVAAVYLSRRDR